MNERRLDVHEPEVGDLLAVTKGPGVTHYGYTVGDGYVVHNHPDGGVMAVPYEKFAADRPVHLVERAPWERQELIRDRALNLLGTPFDLFNFNCEHFVSLVRTGKPESPQLRRAFVAAVILGLIALGGS